MAPPGRRRLLEERDELKPFEVTEAGTLSESRGRHIAGASALCGKDVLKVLTRGHTSTKTHK